MAENKKSFVLYVDLLHTVSKLPDELAGKLFKQILSYVNDENPKDPEDLVLQIAFEPIKLQLKRDLKRWESNIEQRRQAGLRSAEARQRNSTAVDDNEQTSTDNVTVNVNVTVNEIISYLNTMSGKKFKTSSDKNKKVIIARLKEKYTFEDFKKVIDNKVAVWKDDKKMNEYLRPETLFGSKFESYLQVNSIEPKHSFPIPR